MHFQHKRISCQEKLVSYCIQFYIPPKKHLLILTFWSNNPPASCSLMNLDFLLLHTAHCDRNIDLLSLVFGTHGFLLSVSILIYKQYNNIVLPYIYTWYFRPLFIPSFFSIISLIPIHLLCSINLNFSMLPLWRFFILSFIFSFSLW